MAYSIQCVHFSFRTIGVCAQRLSVSTPFMEIIKDRTREYKMVV